MSRDNDLYEEGNAFAWFAGRTTFLTIMGAAMAIGIITAVTLYMVPWARDKETKGFERSCALVSTTKEQLLKLKAEHAKLETQKIQFKDDPEFVGAVTAQQKAIIDRMRIEASKLKADEVPIEVQGMIQ